MIKEVDTYYPQSRKDWRQWLENNHQSKQSIWLVYYNKQSMIPSISWREAVDEALCFGWIDSKTKKVDDSSFIQYFSKRKPKSIWSKINKEIVQLLIDNNRMTKAGFESIEIAKQNGSWSILDEVEELIIPDDLEIAFNRHNGSKDYFLSLSKSTKKIILSWIVLAKRQETKQKRIDEVVESMQKKQVPKQLI
ncbi:YdeI/OmpD-associated family protein [Myroides sp. M-43]|uniref:YdeI/OmpD-associated family protein n=1 Tax=Myroides oncorhynchi TaxID=2893756 RepID=UPI001E60DA2B|nr:YdeI/OmpD-associated family protein [Myroides oncorhynchi]MCC9042959.1 YdeI/OmpD-associated family protein [Myroides oncorhynchi]